jgi:hypothetical protein
MNLQTINQHLLSIEDFYSKIQELNNALHMDFISIDDYISERSALEEMLPNRN